MGDWSVLKEVYSVLADRQRSIHEPQSRGPRLWAWVCRCHRLGGSSNSDLCRRGFLVCARVYQKYMDTLLYSGNLFSFEERNRGLTFSLERLYLTLTPRCHRGGLASTAFFIDPKEQLAAVLLTQLVPSSTFAFRQQMRALTYASLID